MLPFNTYCLLKDLTSLLLSLESFEKCFNAYVNSTVSNNRPTRFLWLFLSFYYYCLLNFWFCKHISSHTTSICSKLVVLPGAFLFTLSVSLNKFLLVEIPGTKQLTYPLLVVLLLKHVYVVDIYIYICVCV